jgi:hypothetical protein
MFRRETEGVDTHIVITNWETPTPHGSHPNLYVRTNSTDGEVMSTLLGFDEVALPLGASVDDADLAVYFLGQSVNGGTTTVHVAGLKPDWEASTATWRLAGHRLYTSLPSLLSLSHLPAGTRAPVLAL